MWLTVTDVVMFLVRQAIWPHYPVKAQKHSASELALKLHVHAVYSATTVQSIGNWK